MMRKYHSKQNTCIITTNPKIPNLRLKSKIGFCKEKVDTITRTDRDITAGESRIVQFNLCLLTGKLVSAHNFEFLFLSYE